MIWLTVANTNTCRIYNYDRKNKDLTLVKNLIHPESILKNQDLRSDKPGHYKGSDTTRGAFEPREEAKEIEIDRFSLEIARELDQGRKNHEFKNLIIAAAPHMNGLIHQHLDKHLKECTQTILKDYTHLSDNEILEKLIEKLKEIKIR